MSEPPTPSTDLENRWNDDPHDEVPPPPPKKGFACSKWTWAAVAVLLAIVIIVPLTVKSAQQENANKEAAADALGELYSPAWSPAMSPAAISTEGAQTVVPAAVPTIAPTRDPLKCAIATQLSCPANMTSNTTDWYQVSDDIVGEAAGDLSGFSIAMSCDGSIVAIGSGQNDGNGDRAGHVRVYRFNSTAWEQLGSDIDGAAALDWFGYSVALAADGRRMAVGARFNDNANGDNTGHVRVFDYIETTGNWTKVGQDVEGEAQGDQSGRSVSLNSDGTRLAVGATANDGSAVDAGHVRVHELNGGVWEQLGEDIDGEAAEDRFGRAVALSADGNKIVIGGYTNDEVGVGAGHVRIFELVSGNWTQIGNDIDGNEAGDWAGLTVDCSGDCNRVVVGAPGNNDRPLPGVSLVFEFDSTSGNWTQMGRDLEGGYSVSISEDGSRVAVGDYKGLSGGTNSGHVNVYEYDGSDWLLLGREITGVEGELSGTSVALSANGERVAISSPVYGDPTRRRSRSYQSIRLVLMN